MLTRAQRLLHIRNKLFILNRIHQSELMDLPKHLKEKRKELMHEEKELKHNMGFSERREFELLLKERKEHVSQTNG